MGKIRDPIRFSDYFKVEESALHRLGVLNANLNVDTHLGDIWRVKTRKDKAEMRRRVLASKASFNTFLEALRSADAQAYNIAADPQGVLVWRRVAALIAQEQHADFDIPKRLDAAGVASVVEQIIKQFRFLIEERGLAKELYAEGKRRPESSAQHLFYADAHSYCTANNIDITPEAETGRGPVDFKASQGFEARVLVEIKLSDNKKLEAGYRSQLEAYRTADATSTPRASASLTRMRNPC